MGKGEKETIVLAVEMGGEVDFIVTDDRLAYVVIDRMSIKKLLFLDLIVELVERNLMDLELAKSIINATLIPTFRRTAKIERQNTEESIGYDVINRNIASLQCPILTPMTYGHERKCNWVEVS